MKHDSYLLRTLCSGEISGLYIRDPKGRMVRYVEVKPDRLTVFCPDCGKHWPAETENRALEDCYPLCGNCGESYESHAEGKCLFQTTRYRSWR